MSVLLEGHLSGVSPADLLQWAGAGGADTILVVPSGPGFRFRFRDGRLIGACRGNAQQDMRDALLRAGLGFEQGLRITEAAREQRIPVVLAAIRLGHLESSAQETLREHLLEVIGDFLELRDGSFFVATAAQPFLEVLSAEAEASELVIEAAHRLDEHRRASSAGESGLQLEETGSSSEALESLFRASAQAGFRASAHAGDRHRDAPRSASGPRRDTTVRNGALRLARRPSPDESLFLTGG